MAIYQNSAEINVCCTAIISVYLKLINKNKHLKFIKNVVSQKQCLVETCIFHCLTFYVRVNRTVGIGT